VLGKLREAKVSGAIDRSLIVRDSRDADVPAIAQIYGHWVRFGFGTFEYDAPGESEIARRRSNLLAGRFPYLVAEDRGVVLGYAYAGPYRPRPGYRFTCEDSVYVAPEAARRGIGRALLSALIPRSEARGFRLMLAVIGDSGNAASIGLHEALGFTHAGVLPSVGWKHSRWVDTVFMTRTLGVENSSAPDA
jgi:phosphinothricin acetyltransferase